MNYSTSPTSSQGSFSLNTSPKFAQDPLVYKMRYDAGRGFDPDDDYEFCPQLSTPRIPATLNPDLNLSMPPLAQSVAPEVISPVRRPAQLKRALDIINPATGLRVSSPKPTGH